MQKEKYYKNLFFIGAIWNWIVAPTGFLAINPMLRYLKMKPIQYPVAWQLFMALVFVYGIAYFYVYKDLVKNRNCAKLGVYSKTAVFVLLTYYWAIGDIHFVLIIPGIVDLIFAGFFVEFLIRYKPNSDVPHS